MHVCKPDTNFPHLSSLLPPKITKVFVYNPHRNTIYFYRRLSGSVQHVLSVMLRTTDKTIYDILKTIRRTE